MAIKCMALYGSRARDDHAPDSDTDLFAITTEEDYRMVFHGTTNIACYPEALAMERADGGDLFFLHIVREAVAIYDQDGAFEKLKSVFRLRADYSREVLNAAELGFALLCNIDNFKNYFYINKRLAWCLRTILIALSAERGSPVFSAKELASGFGDDEINYLLSMKKQVGYVPGVYDVFKRKFARYGRCGGELIPADLLSQLEYFSSKGNVMGEKTILNIMKNVDEDAYL